MKNGIDLYQKINAIGICIEIANLEFPFTDIEKTLLLAVREIPNEARLLDPLLTWIHYHGHLVNTDRLAKMREPNDERLSILGLYGKHCNQSDWDKIIIRPKEVVTCNEDLESTKTRVSYWGEEDWSKNSGFLLAKTRFGRIKEKLVLKEDQIAKKNRHFANKLLYGATAEADIATALEAGFKTLEEIAAICYCSIDEVKKFTSKEA